MGIPLSKMGIPLSKIGIPPLERGKRSTEVFLDFITKNTFFFRACGAFSQCLLNALYFGRLRRGFHELEHIKQLKSILETLKYTLHKNMKIAKHP